MKTVNVKIDADLHTFLTTKAIEADAPLVRYVRKIIKDFAKSQGFEPVHATQAGYIDAAGEMVFPGA